MNERKLLDILKDPHFVSHLVSSTSKSSFIALFKKYDLDIDEKEIAVLQNIVKSIKNDVLNKKIENRELENIAGGKTSAARYVFAPLYYTTYGIGYGLGKCPIIGYTVYHSIKDAITGFYESLHNY